MRRIRPQNLYVRLQAMVGTLHRGTVRRHRPGGFSLVELVTVVVVIGVVAAIALPRISRGAEGAGGAATKADLAVLRKAIDLYAAEHGGAFPAQTADGLGGAVRSEDALISQLIKFTDYQGQASPTRAYPYVYGPYLARGIPPAPIGAYAGSSSVKVVTTGLERITTGNYGWVYNVNTGEIILNTASADEEAELSQKFDMGKGDMGSVGS